MPRTEKEDFQVPTLNQLPVPKKYLQKNHQSIYSGSSYAALRDSATYILGRMGPSAGPSPGCNLGSGLDSNSFTPSASLDVHSKPLVVLGSNGELITAFPANENNETFIDIYDWMAHEIESDPIEIEEKMMYLVGTVKLPKSALILKLMPIICQRSTNYYKLLLIINHQSSNQENNIRFAVVNNLGNYKELNDLPPVDIDINYDINDSYSKEWYILADNKRGKLWIFDNENDQLICELITKVRNEKAIFDLKDNWLIYLASDKEEIDKKSIVPVEISGEKSMANKLMKGFSKTALDALMTFSEVSQSKIRCILPNQNESNSNNNNNNNDNSNNFTTNNNNKIKKTSNNYPTEESNDVTTKGYSEIPLQVLNSINRDSDYVTIISLNQFRDRKPKKKDFKIKSPQIITQFPLSSGCSYIKLSPYDMYLITVSSRGDNIYLWDYTLFTSKIILQDKWVRGKTSGVVGNIIWSKGENIFWIRTEGSGSLRGFVIDWSNYESAKDRKRKRKNFKNNNEITTKNGNFDFLINDSNFKPTSGMIWCLSNFHFKNFQLFQNKQSETFLACISKEDNILVINSQTGLIDSMICVPDKHAPISENFNFSNRNNIPVQIESKNLNEIDPLDEVEIETCKPFLPLYDNKNIKFGTIEGKTLNLFDFGNLRIFGGYENVKMQEFNAGSSDVAATDFEPSISCISGLEPVQAGIDTLKESIITLD
ncbi:hypothetical protein DAMA08_040450 [Martiniozyma asiatica (nom. inval.)]|nr:hypothetical protein DAMA08_040450 [Martiniozyma asiatica]